MRWLLVTVLAWAAPGYGQNAAALVEEIVRDSDFTYETSFEWRCAPDTWEQLVNNPQLMGALWQAYGYAPSYQVSTHRDTLHIDDPTGLEGDAVLVSQTAEERTYLVLGRLNHWAVPFFNQGSAVFVLRSRAEDQRVQGHLTVYIKATSKLGNAVL